MVPRVGPELDGGDVTVPKGRRSEERGEAWTNGGNACLLQPINSVLTPAMTVRAPTSAHRCLCRICENPIAANPTSSKSFMSLISRLLGSNRHADRRVQ